VLLDQHGLLTNEMLQDLLFRDHRDPIKDASLDNPEEAMKRSANRTIIRLKDAELIERRMVWMESRQGFPYPYPCNQLTSHGASFLKRHYQRHGGALRWRASLSGLTDRGARHTLEINRFFVALQRGCWNADVQLSLWRDDRQLAAMDRASTYFDNVPDAFFILESGMGISPFFLEVDRGFETIVSQSGDDGDWATKLERYDRFLSHGYSQAPFFDELPEAAVLTVTTSARRVASMIDATRLAHGGPYWYAPAADLYATKSADALWQPIWHSVTGQGVSLRDLLS
jgi:hypothetical protein